VPSHTRLNLADCALHSPKLYVYIAKLSTDIQFTARSWYSPCICESNWWTIGHLMAVFQDNLGKPVPEYLLSGFYWC